jgi:hypothetical protein
MHSTIQFYFALDKGRLEVLLEADVEFDERGIFYQVRNFRMPGSSSRRVLPDIEIKKRDGHWVHRDSGWHTELSNSVGKAIDEANLSASPVRPLELQRNEDDGEVADAAEGAA